MAQGVWDKTGLTAANTPLEAGWKKIANFDSNISLDLVDDLDADQSPVLRVFASQNGFNSGARLQEIPASSQLEILCRGRYTNPNSGETSIIHGFYAGDPHPTSAAYQRTQIFPATDIRVSQDQPFVSRGTFSIEGASAPDVYEWTRNRIEPTATEDEFRIRSKWWTGAVGDEPASWDADVTFLLAAGQQQTGFPFIQVRSSDQDYYIDFYSWGTDGDSAPTTLSSPPTISNVDGDDAVNQGQLVNIDVSNFTEEITLGDIGGTAFPSIPDNDPSDDVIQVRMPVTLDAGTYDVTISGATETATISGVAYSVTHPNQAPYGLVDSNSDWNGQKLTEDTYWRVITPFAHGTYDFTAGAAETPPFGNDINDHFTPDAGYVGSDSEVREVLYADGTTAQYTVNIEIGEGGTVVVTDGLWRDLFRDPTSEIFTELFR